MVRSRNWRHPHSLTHSWLNGVSCDPTTELEETLHFHFFIFNLTNMGPLQFRLLKGKVLQNTFFVFNSSSKQLELSISKDFFWRSAWPYKEFSQHLKKEEQHHPGSDNCIAMYCLIIHSHFP